MDIEIGSMDACKPASTDICCPPRNGGVYAVQGSVDPVITGASECTLGRHLARRLVQIGVNDVFSVPGDFNLTLLDYLVAEPGLNLVGCCNELNAGYAADGYARSRGVGACVVTFTVGGLSVINAIAGAYSENLPVICIVGGPNSNDYGTNRILHHTIGLPDLSQEVRCFQTVTCYQAKRLASVFSREVEQRDRIIANKDTEIAWLDGELAEAKGERREEVATLEAVMASTEAENARLGAEVARLKDEVDQLKASNKRIADRAASS